MMHAKTEHRVKRWQDQRWLLGERVFITALGQAQAVPYGG